MYKFLGNEVEVNSALQTLEISVAARVALAVVVSIGVVLSAP